MRDHARASFRNAAHTPGVAAVKPRDFHPMAEQPDSIEAASPYAAWHDLLASERALIVGDLLEMETGELFLCKYVGFEKAQWVVPEANATTPAESSNETAAPVASETAGVS